MRDDFTMFRWGWKLFRCEQMRKQRRIDRARGHVRSTLGLYQIHAGAECLGGRCPAAAAQGTRARNKGPEPETRDPSRGRGWRQLGVGSLLGRRGWRTGCLARFHARPTGGPKRGDRAEGVREGGGSLEHSRAAPSLGPSSAPPRVALMHRRADSRVGAPWLAAVFGTQTPIWVLLSGPSSAPPRDAAGHGTSVCRDPPRHESQGPDAPVLGNFSPMARGIGHRPCVNAGII